MSTWLVLLVTGIYFYVAGEQLLKGNWPMAGMWFSYGSANLFLIKSLL